MRAPSLIEKAGGKYEGGNMWQYLATWCQGQFVMVSAVEMIQPGGGTTQVQYRYDKGTINLLSSLILA